MSTAAKAAYDAHLIDGGNPHGVTAAQVGAPTNATFNAHASRHKSGGADAIRLDELAVPTAAVAFNAQKATGLAEPAIGETTTAVPISFVDKQSDPNWCSEFTEDFDSVVIAIANALVVPGRGQFFTTLTGTGAVTALLASTATELGLFQLKPGTTTTGIAFLTHALSNPVLFLASAGELYVSFRSAIDQLSNGTDTFKWNGGLQDTANVAPTNCAVFQHLNGQTNFQIVCTKAGAATTTVDTGVPVDTALHRFEILKADGSTTLRFKIDGNFVDAGGVSTNIPVAGLTEAFGLVNSAGTGAGRAARIDWFHRRLRHAGRAT